MPIRLSDLQQNETRLRLSDIQEESEDKMGVVQKIAQGVAKPFIKTAVSGFSGVKGVVELSLGKKEIAQKTLSKEYDFGYFGKTRPVGISEEGKPKEGLSYIKDVLGTGIEVGSNLYGGGTTAKGVKFGLAGFLKQSFKEGAKAGLVGGVGFGSGLAMQEDKKALDIAVDAIISGGYGLIGGGVLGVGVGAAGKIISGGVERALRKTPKILSYTTDIPESVFSTYLERQKNVNNALSKNLSQQEILEKTQGVVQGFRRQLSDEWKDGIDPLIKEFYGKRISLNNNEIKVLKKVNESFGGIISIPKNPKLVSVNESINLLKSINELYQKRIVRELPQGAFVRDIKGVLRKKVIESFGGEQGLLSSFYKNYSSKKTILDAMESIVKSYKADNPVSQGTAINRLLKVFDENKQAYLDAVLDIERLTGNDILSNIIAKKLSPKLSPAITKAAGGLPVPKSSIQKAIDIITAPLTSPRAAKWLIDLTEGMAGKIEKIRKPIIQGTRSIIKNEEGFAKLPLKDSSFQGFDSLTTKFLNYAKGKTTLSKQEIMDFARRPELKKGEADLLNKYGQQVDGKISAQEFADSIRRDLLELKPVKVKEPQYNQTTVDQSTLRSGNTKFKPTELGKNYEEVVFESPITTNSSSHYPNSQNYFAHARGDEVVESGKKIWREQEIQSDLLQKGGIDIQNINRQAYEQVMSPDEVARYQEAYHANKEEYNIPLSSDKATPEYKAKIQSARDMIDSMEKKYYQEIKNKFSPFENDRYGERIMRERIKDKANKGYEKYRLPTGETIGKIEGFENPSWMIESGTNRRKLLTKENLKIGDEVMSGDVIQNNNQWIITDILDNGRFKAVPKAGYKDAFEIIEDTTTGGKKIWLAKNKETHEVLKFEDKASAFAYPERQMDRISETFDLTGKSNPQYRRYENWGKFLKNKFGGKEVVDPQGNKWVEIDLKAEYKKAPVEAFGQTKVGALVGGGAVGGAIAGGSALLNKDKKEQSIKTKEEKVGELRLIEDKPIPKYVPEKYKESIMSSAHKHDIDLALLSALINTENRKWEPGLKNPQETSSATGLGQHTKSTQEYIKKKYKDYDVKNPLENIDATAWFLNDISRRIGSDKVEDIVQAYNQGVGGFLRGRRNKEYYKTVLSFLSK